MLTPSGLVRSLIPLGSGRSLLPTMGTKTPGTNRNAATIMSFNAPSSSCASLSILNLTILYSVYPPDPLSALGSGTPGRSVAAERVDIYSRPILFLICR
jgi:hypothetical protein